MAKVVVDANLALLLVIGGTGQNSIRSHKRLQAYDVVDFNILINVIAGFSGVLFSPNVLSETSNLVRYVADPLRSRLARFLAVIINESEEVFISSKAATQSSEYIRFGLTDVVLLTMAHSGATLLTSDLDLYLAASRAKLKAINFTHLQAARPDFQ